MRKSFTHMIDIEDITVYDIAIAYALSEFMAYVPLVKIYRAKEISYHKNHKSILVAS